VVPNTIAENWPGAPSKPTSSPVCEPYAASSGWFMRNGPWAAAGARVSRRNTHRVAIAKLSAHRSEPRQRCEVGLATRTGH
jgi:hypothetical protein